MNQEDIQPLMVNDAFVVRVGFFLGLGIAKAGVALAILGYLVITIFRAMT